MNFKHLYQIFMTYQLTYQSVAKLISHTGLYQFKFYKKNNMSV